MLLIKIFIIIHYSNEYLTVLQRLTMDKTELLNIKGRLNGIIKDCKDLIKDLDKKLEVYDSSKIPIVAMNEILPGANFDFGLKPEEVYKIFGRKDIDIFLVGLNSTHTTQQYNFHLVKDSTLTPISVTLPNSVMETMHNFHELLRTRWKPMTSQHLKSLLNKSADRVIDMGLFTPTNSPYFMVNVTQTRGVALKDVRHRNVTYLFPWAVYHELTYQQQQTLMGMNRSRSEFM
jgi:hypothetical protein